MENVDGGKKKKPRLGLVKTVPGRLVPPLHHLNMSMAVFLILTLIFVLNPAKIMKEIEILVYIEDTFLHIISANTLN